jgi:outer membrane receptor protein involved in Fe transport
MNFRTKNLSSAVRLALSFGVIAAGASGTAFAQDSGTAPQTNQTSQKAQTLETITVTGSHIRRVDVETSNPVITIDSAMIRASGKTTLGELVQQLPTVTGGNTNPQVNNAGGSGNTSVGLRGLGAQRTLVLINGKRVITPDGGVDINSIPVEMIERVEVLTDGASSVYGSDAIGGVVNFILKKDYQGATLTLNNGISDRGDGESRGYTFTFGQSSDKGSIMVGLDYNKTDAVLAGARKLTRNAVSLTSTANGGVGPKIGGSSIGPRGNFTVPALDPVSNPTGLTPAQLGPLAGCDSAALNAGAAGTSVNDFHCFGNADRYNFATVNLIMTPQERSSIFVNGTYKLGDHVEAYVTGYHNKTRSAFQLAPGLLQTAQGLNISADSFYNPFGNQAFPGQGTEFSQTAGNFNTRQVEAGNRSANIATTTDQIHTGLRGDFSVWSQDWNWDAGLGYGHIGQDIITGGLPNVASLNPGLGPSFLGGDGVVRCGTPTAVVANCTPFNIFNTNDPATIAALRAATSPALSNNRSIQRVYSVDLNGGLFNLPAGTVQLALGGSYRKEYTASTIDPVLTIDPITGTCALGSQCSSPLTGAYNVKEAYAELFVPILSDLPFAKSLNVTIGDRYSKFSTFGSTNNTKFAVEWRPITDLLLRGTVSEVFRAPTISDVFQSPLSDAPSLSSDPCDGITVASPACVGVPLNGTFVNRNVAQQQQTNGLLSGSQFSGLQLGPERGKSFDLGAVYSPSYIDGLSLSVDAWHVYLNDVITSIGAQQVLNLCASGNDAFCPLIRRVQGGSQAGQIIQIVEPTGNLGRSNTAGVDFSGRYRLPQFDFGNFTLGLDATYLRYYNIDTAPGTAGNEKLKFAGKFGSFGSSLASACPTGGGVCLFPRWRGQGFVNWTLGNFDASWRMRYIGRFQIDEDLNTGVLLKYGATTYNDVSLGYNIAPINTRVDFGVNNLFDKQAPLLYADNTLNANTDPSNFDLLGRYFWARVTVKF